LAGLINTRSECLVYFYETIAAKLVTRFSEREETVRIEVLQAFISLLRQTVVHTRHQSSNTNSSDMITGDSGIMTDIEYVPIINSI
jgi:cullin-associated NEDD8-dissociated protein 1